MLFLLQNQIANSEKEPLSAHLQVIFQKSSAKIDMGSLAIGVNMYSIDITG